MRKALFWLVGLPVTILVATFAVNNRAPTLIDLWPLPYQAMVPTFVLFLGALGIGLLLGALAIWFTVLGLRVRLYNRDLEIKNLKRNLDRTVVENKKLLENKSSQTKALPPAA